MKIMFISVFAIFFYISYFAPAFTNINPLFLIIIYCIMDSTLLLRNYKLRFQGGLLKEIPYEGKALILFSTITVVIGFFYTYDTMISIKDGIKAIHYAVLFICVYLIVKQKTNMDLIFKMLLVIFFLYGLTAVFHGSYYLDRLMVSDHSHPNSLGISMFIGLVAAFYLFSKGWINKLLVICYIPLAMYCIILSGSRKSLIIVGIFLTVAVFLVLLPSLKKIKIKNVVIGSLIIVVVVFSVYKLYLPMYEDSVLNKRLGVEYEEDGSVQGRVDMYNESYRIFKEHPLFGIGYNNFRYYSKYGVYSHSTYAEVLGCAGIIGSLIYFSIYISISIKYIKLYFNNLRNKKSVFVEGMVISFILSNYIFMTTVIDIYHQYFFILLGCFAAHYDLAKADQDKLD